MLNSSFSNLPAQKLAALRAAMTSLDVWLTPSSDEHLNEYLPDSAQRRAWLTGFDGSAGDALVSQDQAWLFVDGRYHQQAGEQVDATCFTVSRLGLEGQPTLVEILQRLARQTPGLRVGVDPWSISLASANTWREALRPLGAKLVSTQRSLVDQVWGSARPAVPAGPIYELPNAITGESVGERLARLREAVHHGMSTQHASKAPSDTWLFPLVRLDHIAWLLNLRGADVPYNPVFMAYALITSQTAWLFVADHTLTPQAQAMLEEQGVEIRPYSHVAQTLREIARGTSALIDPEHITLGISRALKAAGATLVPGTSPLPMMKAIKTPAELQGMRQAHLRASLALIRFWRTLEAGLTHPNSLSEADAAHLADEAYRADPACVGLSFNTIAAYGAHGALIHYGMPDANTPLQPGGLLLIDSGAQYLDRHSPTPWAGTTDTTRVWAIGPPDDKARACYSAVLMAHIDCLRQRFPKGTNGVQLDAITRASLWNQGLDFRHGTGHGVGAFLNVHEGPIGLHARARVALAPAMVVSVEPGYYEPGWGGIRIENLAEVVALCQPDGSPDLIARQTPAYGFESLIYVPYDRRLIDPSALSPAHRQWINAYHHQTLTRLSPHLTPEEQDWLRPWCAAL